MFAQPVVESLTKPPIEQMRQPSEGERVTTGRVKPSIGAGAELFGNAEDPCASVVHRPVTLVWSGAAKYIVAKVAPAEGPEAAAAKSAMCERSLPSVTTLPPES